MFGSDLSTVSTATQSSVFSSSISTSIQPLMISDNLLSDKWFSSMVTTSSIIFFKLNLERTGQYVALIWCNQNNPTLDYRVLPSPDFL